MIKSMFSEFEEVKNNIIRGTIEDHEEMVNLSQDYVNELSNVLILLIQTSEKTENMSSFVQSSELLALSCIIKTCYSVYTLILNGLYREATSLLRTIMEDFQTLLFFQ